MSDLEFVNINGEKIITKPVYSAPKKRASGPDQFHKGWRVVGIRAQEMLNPRVFGVYAKAHPSQPKKVG